MDGWIRCKIDRKIEGVASLLRSITGLVKTVLYKSSSLLGMDIGRRLLVGSDG